MRAKFPCAKIDRHNNHRIAYDSTRRQNELTGVLRRSVEVAAELGRFNR